jgi:predicted nucleic acid-binding protein
VSFLLDTNVVSEKFKGAQCDVNVAAWFDGVESNDLFLSVLVLGEIRKGGRDASCARSSPGAKD